MTIQDWPAAERPRERLLAHGPTALSDTELLAVFLRTGSRGATAVDLARASLARFGSVRALLAADQNTAGQLSGFGPAKWASLQAAVELTRRSLQEHMRSHDALSSPASVRQFLAQ